MFARLGGLGGSNDDPNAWLLTDGERYGVAHDPAVGEDGDAKLRAASRQDSGCLSGRQQRIAG
jgi:hypothetical protein